MKLFRLALFLAALWACGLPSLPIIAHASAEEAPAPAKSGNSRDDPKPDDKKPDKGNEDVTGGRFAGDPIYVRLAPMVLPVINEKGVEQIVTIMFDVQVANFDSADQMHSNMPRVMDALMRHLYGGLGQGVLQNGKLVNINKIKTKATEAVGEVIGIENVRDVLVQGVAQRMF